MTIPTFNRPGVSDAFLTSTGCHHVGHDRSVELYGLQAEGRAIPFHNMDGSPLMVDGKRFARVRLYSPVGDQKYHQRSGSGVHIYIPPGFSKWSKGSRLILTEGEFKCLSLAEAGFAAVGLTGINGAVTGDCVLHPELVAVLQFHQPREVVFLGDSDVVLNAAFASEASKLRRLLVGSRAFPFVQKFTVAKLPLTGPKGIDDLRDRDLEGDSFNAIFAALLGSGYEVPDRVTATEVFSELLRRELEAVKELLAREGHDGSRARSKLLGSATQLWNQPAARLDLKPVLSRALGVTESEVVRMVGDMKASVKADSPAKTEPKQGSALNLPVPEPWPESVNGADVLDLVSKTFSRFAFIPDGAADALALFCAYTHCFQSFPHSPRLNLRSEFKGCGKTTVREIISLFVPRPLLAENLSTAVLFRVIEANHPIVLADECDAWLNGNEELRGMLNAGHKRGGVALRCEGDDHEVRAFNVFGPVVLCGIGALPGTLHDRSIVIRLERAKPGEIPERFDGRRTEREHGLARKLARFMADSATHLAECDPSLPSGAFNRLADNWRPLFAVAQAAGGDWPDRAAAAFAKLNTEDTDAQGVGMVLLADIAEMFTKSETDRLTSKTIVETLHQLEGREWSEWGRASKPISTNQLARLLRRFSVAPQTIRLPDGTTAKGYLHESFPFARYLVDSAIPDRHTVTEPVNIDDSSDSKPSQPKCVLRSENSVSANKINGCYGVTVQKEETAELLL